MKSKVRKYIDKWVKQPFPRREPVYLGAGQVFMYPSASEDKHHLVIRVDDETNSYICSCPGFYYSENDTCRHIHMLQDAISAVLWINP